MAAKRIEYDLQKTGWSLYDDRGFFHIPGFMPEQRKVSDSLFSLIHSCTKNTEIKRKLNKMVNECDGANTE